MGISFHRGPHWGNWRGWFIGIFEREMKEGSGNGASVMKLIWAPFLDPDYVRCLSMGEIWNFYEGPGLP
jgi:hypothetical protein